MTIAEQRFNEVVPTKLGQMEEKLNGIEKSLDGIENQLIKLNETFSKMCSFMEAIAENTQNIG